MTALRRELRRGPLFELLLAFFAATAVSSALFWTGRVVPVVGDNLHGLIAIVFLYTPALASRWSGRPFSYDGAGLRLRPLGLGAAVAAAVALVTWPLFFGMFLAFYGTGCGAGAPSWVAWWTRELGAPCASWRGFTGATWVWPPEAAWSFASQLLVVAVPEELFFRGYLMGRLEERWPSRRAVLGALVGWPLVVSSALFALGHVLVDFDPGRFAVFFPGLVFGWMRARTGSLAAGALYHALCNVLSDVLHRSFF